MKTRIYNTDDATARLQDSLTAWYVESNCICREYKTGGWKSSLMLTNAIAHLAEVSWHHPEIVVNYNRVLVKLTDHAAKGISDKDFELATKIESVVLWQPALEAGALTGTPDDPRYVYIVTE